MFRLRNASARPVSFTYPFPLFAGGGDPTVCDARGAPLSLHLPAIDIPVHPTPITLAPGRSVDLGRPRILLLSSEAAERLAETALTAPPGRYRVSQRLALEAHAAGEWAGEVVTGTLDLEILRPEPGAAGPGG